MPQAGKRLKRPPLKEVKKFVARLELAGLRGCWRFSGHHDTRERPQIKIGGKVQWAYRVAMAVFCGEVKEGMEVDHICNHPWCVNPAHLRQVTQEEHTTRENHGRRRKPEDGEEQVPF